jgi:uncharacterized membrane protein YuzA (DUF378 family)
VYVVVGLAGVYELYFAWQLYDARSVGGGRAMAEE